MKNIKKVLIIDPYLDTLGGGERHILSIAKIFHDKGAQIAVAWRNEQIIGKMESRFKLGLKNMVVDREVLKKGSFERIQAIAQYDCLFYVTDGSYFFSSAKQNYVFCMYPQQSLYQRNFLNNLKWKNCQFIANSNYTAEFISLWTGKEAKVVYPYIDDQIFSLYSLKKKEKLILSVGRFFSHLHSKKQEVLIESFNKLQHKEKVFKDFKLILIGGLKDEDKNYFEKIKRMADKNASVILLPNASREIVLDYYQKAYLYWHAAGYGTDEKSSPEAVEHLGITPLEAMAAGCLTFCHNSGGPKEYITDGRNGYLYTTIDELLERTRKGYENKDTQKEIIGRARKTIQEKFSHEVFEKKVSDYFKL